MPAGIVVVLGKTGSNFAGGMSGGIAFILNEDGKFEQRCNMGMVELEKVAGEDKTLLHEMIESHYRYTGSRKAKTILDASDLMLSKFVKIMPIDYKRVLAERSDETAQ